MKTTRRGFIKSLVTLASYIGIKSRLPIDDWICDIPDNDSGIVHLPSQLIEMQAEPSIKQGDIIYVSSDGIATNDGNMPDSPLPLGIAISNAVDGYVEVNIGTVVYMYGYNENLPL